MSDGKLKRLRRMRPKGTGPSVDDNTESPSRSTSARNSLGWDKDVDNHHNDANNNTPRGGRDRLSSIGDDLLLKPHHPLLSGSAGAARAFPRDNSRASVCVRGGCVRGAARARHHGSPVGRCSSVVSRES